MKRMVIIFRDFFRAADQTLLLLCVPLLIISLLISSLQDTLSLLFAFVYPACYASVKCRRIRYAVFTGAAVASGSLLCFGITGAYLSLPLCLLFSVVAVAILNKCGYDAGCTLSLLSVVLLSFLWAKTNAVLLPRVLPQLTAAAGKSGVFFGVLSHLFRLFISDSLDQIMYTTNASKALLINGEIISGVKAIAASGSRDSSVAAFLTGKYMENVFLTLGLTPLFLGRLPKSRRAGFLMLVIYTMITGENRLFSFWLFIYHPLLFVTYLIGIVFAFLLPPLLHLNIGFENAAGLIELIGHMEHPVILILSGFLLAALMYFLARMVLLKTDFQRMPYYPKKVRGLLEALGGRDNIIAVMNGQLRVVNPNLVNILRLDCDIQQDRITLQREDYDAIRAYLKE